jgi:hypothetical protein
MPAYRALCIEEVGGSVIDDSTGGDEGGQGDAQPEEEIDLNALFFDWNKYIVGINKQIDLLLDKKKTIDEHELKKRIEAAKAVAPGADQQILPPNEVQA